MSGEFPILFHWRRDEAAKERALGCPASISWALIAPHERQALRNHSQSLKRLAERGGLSACEAVAVLEDREWHKMTRKAAIARLNELIAKGVG